MTYHVHAYPAALSKAFLSRHMRVEHPQPDGSSLVSADSKSALLRWPLDQLRAAHASYHRSKERAR